MQSSSILRTSSRESGLSVRELTINIGETGLNSVVAKWLCYHEASLRGVEADLLDEWNERWALVTGASSGIGAEFARRLAARGMHVVLTARRESLLEELAEDLHTRHGSRTEIIACDLSEPGKSRWLMEQINAKGLQIELLINSAGFGYVGDVETTDPDTIRSLIDLNIGALTDLTYAVLPGMLERRHGGVINVSSLAAFQPVAYMAAYAATKSFVLHFSEAMWAEVRDRGVTVLGLCPGVTETPFFETAGIPKWLEKNSSQKPGKVVKTALKALEKRKQYVIPGWKNYFMSLLIRYTTRRTAVNEARKYFRPKTRKDDAKSENKSDSANGEVDASETQNTDVAAKQAIDQQSDLDESAA